jgi:16S rRNA (cytosine1402-N4)-methyltransferase
MDRTRGITASELLVQSSEAELTDILGNYGEIRNPQRMAKALRNYGTEKLKAPSDIEEALRIEYGSVPMPKVMSKLYQALRIAVNGELKELEDCLEAAVRVLRKDGRLAVISYHSLEDRIVKEFIRKNEGQCTCPKTLLKCICEKVVVLKRVTKKPISPSAEEVVLNRRARSAHLRIAEKAI